MRKRAEDKQNIYDTPTEGKRTARTRSKRQTQNSLDKLLLKYPTVDDVGGMILQNSCESVALTRKLLKPEECTVAPADIETLVKHFIAIDPQNYSVIKDYMNVHTLVWDTAINRVLIASTRASSSILKIVAPIHALTFALPPFTYPNEPALDQDYIDLCNMYAAMLDKTLIINFLHLISVLREVYLTDGVLRRLGEYTDLPLGIFTGFSANNLYKMAVNVRNVTGGLVKIVCEYNDSRNKNKPIKISEKGLNNLMTLASWNIDNTIIITDADIDRDLNGESKKESLLNVKAKRCKK